MLIYKQAPDQDINKLKYPIKFDGQYTFLKIMHEY